MLEERDIERHDLVSAHGLLPCDRAHAAYLLATPGSVRPLTGRHAGSLLTGWLGVSQVGLEP